VQAKGKAQALRLTNNRTAPKAPPSVGGFLGRLSRLSQFLSAIHPGGAMLHNIAEPSERHKSALT